MCGTLRSGERLKQSHQRLEYRVTHNGPRPPVFLEQVVGSSGTERCALQCRVVRVHLASGDCHWAWRCFFSKANCARVALACAVASGCHSKCVCGTFLRCIRVCCCAGPLFFAFYAWHGAHAAAWSSTSLDKLHACCAVRATHVERGCGCGASARVEDACSRKSFAHAAPGRFCAHPAPPSSTLTVAAQGRQHHAAQRAHCVQ